VAACDEVACPFSVSRQSIPQFSVEQCSPGYQRTSPASVACYPLCQTSYNGQIIDFRHTSRGTVCTKTTLQFYIFLFKRPPIKYTSNEEILTFLC